MKPVVIGPRWDWGDRLRKIRRSIAHANQLQMAEIVGVRPATYSAWEGGRNEPSLTVARAIAERLERTYPGQVTAAWVLGAETRLPRMDSNHQPPGWRHHRRNMLGCGNIRHRRPRRSGDPSHLNPQTWCASHGRYTSIRKLPENSTQPRGGTR